MRENERDALRDLDWTRVYARAPGAVEEGARVAFARIRARERRRQRIARGAALAACLVLIAGGGAMLLLRGGGGPQDRVAAQLREAKQLNADDAVYASRADAYYHVAADCPEIEGRPVALQLITAVEFEKELCPACGADRVAPVLPERIALDGEASGA